MRYPLRIAGALAMAASLGCASSVPEYGAPVPPDGDVDERGDAAADGAPDGTGAAQSSYGGPALPDAGTD